LFPYTSGTGRPGERLDEGQTVSRGADSTETDLYWPRCRKQKRQHRDLSIWASLPTVARRRRPCRRSPLRQRTCEGDRQPARKTVTHPTIGLRRSRRPRPLATSPGRRLPRGIGTGGAGLSFFRLILAGRSVHGPAFASDSWIAPVGVQETGGPPWVSILRSS
jgi:hypothetical protein